MENTSLPRSKKRSPSGAGTSSDSAWERTSGTKNSGSREAAFFAIRAAESRNAAGEYGRIFPFPATLKNHCGFSFGTHRVSFCRRATLADSPYAEQRKDDERAKDKRRLPPQGGVARRFAVSAAWMFHGHTLPQESAELSGFCNDHLFNSAGRSRGMSRLQW